MNYPALDLHHLNGIGKTITQEDVWLALDKFISKIKIQNNKKIRYGQHVKINIIVGKGLQSKNLINGKNPLRYFAENYLNLCGYTFKDGEYFNGQNGTIVAEII
jgi:hypothetical protein